MSVQNVNCQTQTLNYEVKLELGKVRFDRLGWFHRPYLHDVHSYSAKVTIK